MRGTHRAVPRHPQRGGVQAPPRAVLHDRASRGTSIALSAPAGRKLMGSRYFRECVLGPALNISETSPKPDLHYSAGTPTQVGSPPGNLGLQPQTPPARAQGQQRAAGKEATQLGANKTDHRFGPMGMHPLHIHFPDLQYIAGTPTQLQSLDWRAFGFRTPTQGDTHGRASRRTSLCRFRKGLLPRATTEASLAACSAGAPPTRPPSAAPWCGARVAGRPPT